MEFFHDPKIDWMGKKWYFIAGSMILFVAGMASIAIHGGLNYGIEFRSGTQVLAKFSTPPKVEAIRRELNREKLGGATIQRIGTKSANEVMIEVPLANNAAGATAVDAGKKSVVKALTALYGGGAAGKVNFNDASAQTLANHLVVADPLGLAAKGMETATGTYQKLAQTIVDFRDHPPQSGLISSFGELSRVEGVTPAVISTLKNDFYLSGFAISNTEVVGPKVGSDLRRQAVYVTLAGLVAMLIYVSFRFEPIYGVSAVIAVFHDTLITIGFFSLFSKEITLSVIAALLTLVGYSMNDTIVTFDRVRENVHTNKREKFSDLVNRSINQTLSRTILTSGLTFLAVMALYLFGGEVIHGFAFALVVGVLIGTYSSFAIASPILVYWQSRSGKTRAKGSPKVSEREVAAARR